MSEPLKRRLTFAQQRLLIELEKGGVWLIRCTLTDTYTLYDQPRDQVGCIYRGTAEAVIRNGWVSADREPPRRNAIDVFYRLTDSGRGQLK